MDYTLSQSLATRTAQFLAQHPPYSFLGEDILKKLAASMTIQYFAAHQFIFQEGEPARHMIYILQKGQVELMQEVEGETRLIDVCDVGDSFGYALRLQSETILPPPKHPQIRWYMAFLAKYFGCFFRSIPVWRCFLPQVLLQG